MRRERCTTRPDPIPASLVGDSEVRLRREMSRVAGLLYASGGLLVLVALDDRADSPVGVALVAICAIVFGLGLWWVGERVPLPTWVHAFTSTLGIAVVSAVVLLGGEATAAPYGIFFVYVAAFSFYYQPVPWAVAEVVLASVCYAAALAALDVPGGRGLWVLVMGASITAGALIGRLGQRQRSRITAMAAYDVARATMLRIVSHDLRGPLGTIIGSADTLLHQVQTLSAKEIRDLARAQQRQARKLLELVDEVLAAERVQAGRLSLERHPTELRSLVEGVVDASGGARGRVQVTGGPLVAPVDPALLPRAIENLVANALRHAADQVRVDIVGDPVDGVRIRVSDDGAGIPDELLGSVFEPFVQGSQDGGTTGLGLYLARAIVHAHGGELSAANGNVNGNDRGAHFTITLPPTP